MTEPFVNVVESYNFTEEITSASKFQELGSSSKDKLLIGYLLFDARSLHLRHAVIDISCSIGLKIVLKLEISPNLTAH